MVSRMNEEKYTSEVAKELGISENTLRKYSQMIEKTTGNARYFDRKSNARVYSNENITALRKVIQLSKSGKSLQSAIEEVFLKDESSKENPEDLTSLKGTIDSQNELISELQKQLAELKKETSTKDEEKSEENSDERVTLSASDLLGFDDIPDLETDDDDDKRPLTPEQKRMKVAADMKRPADEVRAEMMDKIIDNAEKNPPTHRTLADMQLPRKKKHWWQRLRKS